MFDKINFVYTAFPHLGAAYFGTHGLEKALRKIGRLHYAFNIRGGEFLNQEELRKYPILYMSGHTAGKIHFIEAAGGQFKATFQSESFFTRHGKLDTSSSLLREREKMFDMIFTVADSDMNTYSIPTVFCSPWADREVMYPMPRFGFNDSLFFMGGRDGREDFLSQDKEGLIKSANTEFHPDPVINVTRYTELMSKYFHILNPPGRFYNGVTGRMWEIMACGNLCYQYHNPDTMFKTLADLKDGRELVLFQTMDELKDKYKYYSKNINEALNIASRGYQYYLDGHTEIHRANFLANTILEAANKPVCV